MEETWIKNFEELGLFKDEAIELVQIALSKRPSIFDPTTILHCMYTLICEFEPQYKIDNWLDIFRSDETAPLLEKEGE